MAEASSQDCGVMGHDDSSTPHLADATVSTTAQEELATPQSAGTRPSPSAEEEPVLPTNGLTSRPWRMPSKGAGEGKIGSPPVNLGLDRQPIQTSPFKSLRRIWRIHGTLVRLIFFSLFPIIQVRYALQPSFGSALTHGAKGLRYMHRPRPVSYHVASGLRTRSDGMGPREAARDMRGHLGGSNCRRSLHQDMRTLAGPRQGPKTHFARGRFGDVARIF